jgi:large subunit ribosomal protein L7e
VVPENIQKKQARDAKVLKQLADKRAAQKKERIEKRKVYLANAEKYHHEVQDRERSLIDEKRKAKAAGNIFVQPEAKLALVVRIRG